jgi:nucleotide-binding universal stress UspA family protein
MMRKIAQHCWNFPQGPESAVQNTPPMRYLESESPGTTSALVTSEAEAASSLKGVAMSPFQTVVVATDFSETAEDALSAGLELVGGARGRLELLNVVLDPLHQPWMIEAVGIDFEALQHAWVEAAKAEFRTLLKRRQLDSSNVTTHVVVGRPDTEIVRFAQERGADLIVMGTHGYGGVKRLLLGSVADHVVRQATCPVLVVPHPAARSEGATVAIGQQAEPTVESSGIR